MSAGLLSVLLVVARIAPATYVLSVFGGVQLNRLARLAVIVAVSVAAWPGSIGGAAPGALDVIVRVGSQLAVGLGAAAGAVGFFELARTAGALADVSLGRGSFGAADPFGGAAGPLGTLHSLTFLAVIFASGGHCIVLAAIAAGFDAFPLDATLTEADIGALAAHAVDASGAAIALAAGLALPAIAVAWTIDLALGWLGRVLPSLPATFLAMPLKMLVGWIVVATTLAVVVDGTVSSALDAFDAALTSPSRR
ncbi:MAG: flagellar biosynthetic protein FliR [Myxococcales bacterium]|nr:flagellar biosynthetic protein FliR [Myxococcales bacterium]